MITRHALDRFVAIKVLPPERVADAARKARFVQEAKAASALNHPNIITIYDISSEGGHDFIAMEYVAGKTLEQLIGRKGLALNDTLKYAIQIADALARAHAAGIIHRDLKPSNFMVDEHGLAKVLDFGLAKLTETATPGEDAPTQTLRAATEEGTIVGTTAYMSPEQAAGKALAESDPVHAGLLGYTCARLGDRAGAEWMLKQLTSPLRSYVPPVDVAAIYNGLGQPDRASEWLERAYQDRSPLLLWVAVDPRFESLHQSANFLTLIRRMGFAVRQ